MRQPGDDPARSTARSRLRARGLATFAALGLMAAVTFSATWLAPRSAVAMVAQSLPTDEPVLGEDENELSSEAEVSEEAEATNSAPEESSTSEEDPEEEEPPPKLATLVFTTDAACNLYVDGVSVGVLEADQPLEVPAEALTLTVVATAADLAIARWTEDLVLEPDEVREIAIPMLETVEDQRKKERREQVYRDIDRGWMWGRRDNARDIAWSGAGAYCEELDLGAFDNWRLPSLEELETLESMWSLMTNKIAEPIALTSCCLWSSTTGSPGTAWNLDFRFRRTFEINRTLSFGLRALCVREMEPDELAESRLAADPKEQKRRLREKRKRLEERKRRLAEKAQSKKTPEPEESPLNRQNMSYSATPERAADTILRGFDDHHERFRAITRRTRERFERRDWDGIRWDTVKRLELYDQCIQETIDALREQLRAHFEDREAWAAMKVAYTRAILGRNDFELAETYFNSLTRKVFPHVGVDPRIDYVSRDFPVPFKGWEMASARMYGVRRVDRMLIQKILEDAGFRVPFRDLEAQAQLAADRVEQAIREAFGVSEIEAVDVLQPVFIRNQAAYVVGRIRRGERVLPMIFAVLNQDRGLEVDAVLLTENDTSILFSFARWYLHADLASPREVIGFLHSLLPRKRVSELYTSLGYNKHGKSEFFADLLATIDSLDEQFVVAPGEPGLVMAVFTLPSFEFVFKVIKDVFPSSKSTTRDEIRRRYRQVLLHDRVGRLVDYQVFEHVVFPRSRFSPALLAELLGVAGETVVSKGDKIIIRHMYVGRRVTPLDIFLPAASPQDAEAAILDWGQTLKDLAAADIFTGDILLKNFGLTRHRRVVFYDYDEVCSVSSRNFRRFPKPRNDFEEMASEPWFSVARNDVFPEELNSFLGFSGDLRRAFERVHGDLADIEFWEATQERIRAGEVLECHPYPERLRLRTPTPSVSGISSS